MPGDLRSVTIPCPHAWFNDVDHSGAQFIIPEPWPSTKDLQLRRDKLKQIEALGQAAYPRHSISPIPFRRSLKDYGHTAEELEAARVEVRVAGRIMAIRLMGKAGFAHLQQDGKRLQIYVKKDAVGEKGFELYKLLDLGDHIGVQGYLFRTRTGELTVHVEELTFLVKDLLPLPEKWHGLTDVETPLPPALRRPDR